MKQYIGVVSGSNANSIKDEILKDNPVGYWQLDETTGTNAINLGSGMSNGTYNNVLLSQPKLAHGSAYSASFNGVSSKVSFANTLLNANADISLECIVRLSSASLKGSFIKVGINGVGIGVGVGNTTHDNLGNNLIALAEGIAWKSSDKQIGIGTHHIVLVFKGASNKEWLFYLDGFLIVTLPSQTISNPNNGGLIGAGDTPDRYANALIDEVAIYNKILLLERCFAHANTVIY